MKRICSLLLVTVLLFCSLGCGQTALNAVAASFLGIPLATEQAPQAHPHTALSFAQLNDDAPDLDLELARSRELLFRIRNGECTGTDAQRLLDCRIEAFRRLRTAAAIAYVRYCADAADAAKKQAYDRLSVALEELACILIDAQLALSADPSLSDRYDEETVSQLKQADALHDLSVQPLIEREQERIGAYEALGSLTVSYRGREWTKEEILSDETLTYDAFSELYKSYRRAYNAAAGAIYLDLIAIRRETARTLGFASYAEYGYASYARDYSPADAQVLADSVKRELVPIFTELETAFYEASMRLGCGTFRMEPTLKRTETVIRTLLPELIEPWDYMFSHGMYDFGGSGTRLPGSFTTYFETYGTPFLFTTWDDSCDMPTTLLHEFGHCAGYYLNGVQRMQSRDPLDLAEIDSQGLELLAVSQYDILYGALADAARLYSVMLALYAVITGCMEDEFQQYAYRAQNATLDSLNETYARLAEEYGLRGMGLSGESWTEISHTFRAPMYYISYATSMLAALQLLVRSETDAEGAARAYRAILMRPIGATFLDTIRAAGLRDPFEPETVTALAQKIRAMCVE